MDASVRATAVSALSVQAASRPQSSRVDDSDAGLIMALGSGRRSGAAGKQALFSALRVHLTGNTDAAGNAAIADRLGMSLEVLIGGTTERIVRALPCSMLLVKPDSYALNFKIAF